MQTILVSFGLFFQKTTDDSFVFLPSFQEGASVLKSVSARFSIAYCLGESFVQKDEMILLAIERAGLPKGEIFRTDAAHPAAFARSPLSRHCCAGIGMLEDHRLFVALGVKSLIVHPHALSWNDVSEILSCISPSDIVIRPIAHIRTGFSEKFGIPRQSGLVQALCGTIVFEEEFRRIEAVKEIEGFSHLWLIWQFSQAVAGGWRPTVRPPRLGGNRRVGVFASRAPYRPNHLGLSCVKLEKVDRSAPNGPLLVVSGVDMLDQTPIFDIKPYIPIADCPAQPLEGYTRQTKTHLLTVDFPQELAQLLPNDTCAALKGVLASDPRPGYEDSPQEIYGLSFNGFDIGFRVENGVAHVLRVNKL